MNLSEKAIILQTFEMNEHEICAPIATENIELRRFLVVRILIIEPNLINFYTKPLGNMAFHIQVKGYFRSKSV